MTGMSNSERVTHYLNMANGLRVLAAQCGDAETTAAYLELAAMWVRLADEAQDTAANDPELETEALRSNEA
jgi:hypothetical protein